MARIGQGLLQAMAQPAYAQQLGEAVYKFADAPRRRAEEEQVNNFRKGMLTALVEGQGAVANGDLDKIDSSMKSIQDLMAQSNNPQLVEAGQEAILKLAEMKTDANPAYVTNSANKLLKQRGALEKINEEIDGYGQRTAENAQDYDNALARKEAITKTIDGLESNGQILTAANTLDRQLKIQEIEDQELIRNAGVARYENKLLGLKVDSDEWKKTAEEATKNGFGRAVSNAKTTKLEIQALEDEREDYKRRTGPLSKAEKERLSDAGIDPEKFSNSEVARSALESVLTAEINAKSQAQINRDVLMKEARAKAFAKSVVRDIAEQGDTDSFFAFWTSDIEDKIDNLTPEDYEEIGDLVTGLGDGDAIQREVEAYLRRRFSDEMEKFDKQVGREYNKGRIIKNNAYLIQEANPGMPYSEAERIAKEMLQSEGE